MADLSERDRGQLILVAAFALAVIFISLALVVNAAIFTENLASRSETAGSEGALSMRAMVEGGVGNGVDAANQNNYSNYTNLTNAVDNSTRNVSVQTGRQQARLGRVVSVSYDPSDTSLTTNGTRLGEADQSDLANAGTGYLVAADISRVDGGNGTRAFEINASTIASTSNSTAFEIIVNNTSAAGLANSWRTNIYLNDTDTVHVRTIRTDNTGSTTIEDCEVTRAASASQFYIDVTDGTVNDRPCPALGTNATGQRFHFGAGTNVTAGTGNTYNIYFRNADVITGNFSMVVNNSTTSPTVTAPIQELALYDVTVRYNYWTSALRYETDIRVAPGEPDD